MNFDLTLQTYEKMRDFYPQSLNTSILPQKINHLVELQDKFDAFIFDGYGVININLTPIPSTIKFINNLLLLKKTVAILTNASSYTEEQNRAKFISFGCNAKSFPIISSRDCMIHSLQKHSFNQAGIICRDEDRLVDEKKILRLDENIKTYDKVDLFLCLSVVDFNPKQKELLITSLKNKSREVWLANPDISAPLGDSFSTEPGFFIANLQKQVNFNLKIFGKPAMKTFEFISSKLPTNIKKNKILMIGDSLHTDILGANAFGFKSLLMKDYGLFKGKDVFKYMNKTKIFADFVL